MVMHTMFGNIKELSNSEPVIMFFGRDYGERACALIFNELANNTVAF